MTMTSSSFWKSTAGSSTAIFSRPPSSLRISATVPTLSPFGYTPPKPEVTTTSPSSTSAVFGMLTMRGMVGLSISPSTMPATRESARWTSVPTDERGSSRSWTFAEVGPASMTWPTSPLSVTTAMSTSTPSRVPRLISMTLDQVADSRPMTLAATRSNCVAVCL